MPGRSAAVAFLVCALIVVIALRYRSPRQPAPAAAQQQHWQEARQAYQEGIRAEDEGQYREAIRQFSRVIGLDPADDSAFLHRGLCRLGMGDSDPAIADFTQSLAIQPDNSKAYQLRAVAYYRTGKYADAVADLDEAIERNPSMATYYFLRGQSFAMWRQTNRAIDDYTKALTLEPNAQAYLDRAEAYLRLGERGRAFGDLNRALTMGAKLVRPGELLALVRTSHPPARVDVTAFATLDPERDGEAVTWTFQARSRVEKGLYDEAFELFAEALKLSPQLALAYNSRGYAYLRQRSYDRAIEDFSAAIGLHSLYLNAYQNRAVARRLAGDREGYLEDRKRESSLRGGQTAAAARGGPGN